MINIIRLSNGIRLVSEHIPYVRSVAAGVWVATGSRRENGNNNGISHFIEHMLFKGTDNRTARDIAQCIESIGGQLNAFTGKECTCFYTKTLDEDIEAALDVLSDILRYSRISEEDIATEKRVVSEEISMYEDTPDDIIHDILCNIMWKNDSLGFPIIGSMESLDSITRQTVTDYMSRFYCPSNTVIAVAGNFSMEKLLELCEKYFGSWDCRYDKIEDYPLTQYSSGFFFKEKDIEQMHLCIGFKGIEQGSDDLYSLMAVNNIFGGTMSSRLFQSIREKNGLAYSVYSFPSSYKHAGSLTIYAATNPGQTQKVLQLVSEEIRGFLAEGFSSDDLEKAKSQLKGNFILGLESTGSRMNSIGKSELLLERIYTPDQVLGKIDAIDMDTAKRIAESILNTDKYALAVVGRSNNGINEESFHNIMNG